GSTRGGRSGRGGAWFSSSSGCAEMYSPSSSYVQPTTTTTTSASATIRATSSRAAPSPWTTSTPGNADRIPSSGVMTDGGYTLLEPRSPRFGTAASRPSTAKRLSRAASSGSTGAPSTGSFFRSTIDFAAASYASDRCASDATTERSGAGRDR